jgi:hypothetical protein
MGHNSSSLLMMQAPKDVAAVVNLEIIAPRVGLQGNNLPQKHHPGNHSVTEGDTMNEVSSLCK